MKKTPYPQGRNMYLNRTIDYSTPRNTRASKTRERIDHDITVITWLVGVQVEREMICVM
jgi:hypothetical protein